MRGSRLSAALAALVIACAGSAAAMTILPLDLPELTGQAERIFVGRVLRVESGRDAHGLPAVWTTFAVAQQLKGIGADHVTLKQLGASLDTGAEVLPHPALPRYRPGESVVLFVHPASVLGFTSPVGLGQGCFRVHGDDDAPVVANDVGNRNLAAATGAPGAGTQPQARSAAPPPQAGAPPLAALPLDVLLARVRGLVATSP